MATNDKIQLAAFKSALKSTIQSMLPDSAWTSSNSPDPQLTPYLTTKQDLYNTLCNMIDQAGTPASTNDKVHALNTWTLMRNIFVEMGRCRKVYWFNAGSSAPGTTASPASLASQYGINPVNGTWTYFKKSFSFTGNYGVKPTAVSNVNTDVSGYQTLPDRSTNWNDNTARGLTAAQLISVNNMVNYLTTMTTQVDRFKTAWQSQNNKNTWYSGNSGDTSDTSNIVFFVRYWCHSNCHSNCHGNCHTNRSRR